ncbi:MAG TPA: hypothetical protein VME69_11705 [Methylocella sp.]|nr:hypothetical protein [Methylocella sp.]
MVLIDAAGFPHKPANVDPGAVWEPAASKYPGSVWIPGTGEVQIESNVEAYFRDRLAVLTGGNLHQPIVSYRHPQFWRAGMPPSAR